MSSNFDWQREWRRSLDAINDTQRQYDEIVARIWEPLRQAELAFSNLNATSDLIARHFSDIQRAVSHLRLQDVSQQYLTAVNVGANRIVQALQAEPRLYAQIVEALTHGLGEWALSVPVSLNLLGNLEYSGLSARALESSFGGQMRRYLDDLDVATDDDDDRTTSGAFESLVVLFIRRCAALAPNSTHFYGMLGILSFILTMYAMIDASRTERRLLGEVRASEERLAGVIENSVRRMLEGLESLRSRPEMLRQRVVHRQTILRQRPEGKAPAIRVIYPNEIVEQLEAKSTWIHVRAFDYVRGEATSGWMLKKYTKLTGE